VFVVLHSAIVTYANWEKIMPTDGSEQKRDVDLLLAGVRTMTNLSGTMIAIVSKVEKTLAEEVVEARMKLLLIAVKEYQKWKSHYVTCDKPTGCFYTKDDKGQFVRTNTYSEDIVVRLNSLGANIEKLKLAIDKCLEPLAPTAVAKAFDELQATMTSLGIGG
jgi:pyruvate dehydrogenase complex dehydrogenase (E1) component